ncbi:CCR4-NOT transcription complex subunit 6 [Nymphon striatum]|nr:CCR4-NOT transcription complex subunit 6 [Nymphon striatum]
MCYNVLCDKYATRQLYGYCPNWALSWEYRKKGILDEIRHYNADIISLQAKKKKGCVSGNGLDRREGRVRTAFDRKEKGESAELMEEVMKCLESLESLWGDFESGLGVTARLWSMYIDMMLILRRYIHAERAGLWQQHLQEVRNMLPYTIASGHSKYMSCLPIYLNEMQKLPETAPEVHEEFAAGKFTVHQTAGDFNGVWTDLAMAFIQRFNTLGSSTFGQLQERYRDKLLNMKPRHCTEVHFVGDQYDFELKSLKCDERQRQESNINLPEYVPANSMKIPDWKTLLSNPCNRTNMLSYLASRWSQEAFWPAGFCLVLGVNAQATRVTQTEHTDVDELYCLNHEEADTRIFAHIASCDDNNLWVEKNDLFLSIHDLVNELAKAVGKDGLALTDTLLISYILSGCDSVSYPFKRGKKRTVKVALEHVDKHPTLSNCIRHESGPSAHDQVITEARSFFCDLYGKPGYLSLDKLRAHLFASSKLDLRSLPPTEDAFHFHVLRSLCQICLYKQASLSNPVLLPPEEYGRIVDGDRLIPVMKSKPSKPSAAKLKYCKCKKKPNCLRNCPCAKTAVPCIIACACNGDREKCERLLADHYDDDDDDDEEEIEVETDQFYKFFLPELKQDGYNGIFSPKSRAKTMAENERKYVDGCAIFYKTEKYALVKEHLFEFNQLAMANAEGSDDMLNRVMTKDNIGLAALLETRQGAWTNGVPEAQHISQTLLVCTAHIHWDPEYCDVKLIQTMMLMKELRNLVDEEMQMNYRSGAKSANTTIPIILCGDLNSLPNSGVFELMMKGRISADHEDFKGFRYKDCLQKLGHNDSSNEYTLDLNLASAYT